MSKTLKIVISLLIILALISPMAKVFASFDTGECAVIVIIEGGHGTYKISNGEIEETFTGNSNNFFPSGTELVLTAVPEEGYHVDGWFHCQENGEGAFESQGAPMSCEKVLNLTVTEDHENILVRFDPGEELEEIRLSGSVEGVEEGVLPEFTVESETAHVTAEAFGRNWIEMPPDSGIHIDFGSRWARLSPEFDEWVDFPDDEIPEAIADSGIFYGMKVAVTFDPGYTFTNNTKIIYNDHDFTDTYSRFEPTENGGFVIVDMGQVFGEEENMDMISVGDEILNVNLDVRIPTIGTEITMTEEGTLTQTPQAVVNIDDDPEFPYRLAVGEDGQYMYYFGPDGNWFGGVFEEGKQYLMHIFIEATGDYYFSDTVNAYVNSEYANVIRDEEFGGIIVEYAFEPEAEPVEYNLSCNDGEYSVTFYDHEGEVFQLNMVDILTLTPEQIEEAYGMPAEAVEEVIEAVKENVKDYGDLISLYGIDIDGNHYNYSDGLVLRIKVTEAMEKYNAFKFLFLDENNGFSLEEEYDVDIEETEEGKFLVIELDHLSAYALVGTNVETAGEEEELGTTEKAEETPKSNPKTGDQISTYVSMLVVSLLGLSVIINFTNKTKH